MATASTRILFAVGVLFAATSLRADIAPTEFVGYGISPVKAEGVRMLSAHVDIDWGARCTLSATFVIDNQTGKSADIQLGFPIQNVVSRHSSHNKPEELTFAFDGVPVLPASIAINDPVTQKLESLLVKNVEIQNWEDARFVQYLNDESKQVDPAHKGVKFVLRKSPSGVEAARKLGKITVGLDSGNFFQILNYAEFQYSIEGDTVYVERAYFEANIYDPDQYTWYRCRHIFPPGQTKVLVTTKFPASLTELWPYRERIFYCIETGGSWEGNIGSEEVVVHFPHPVAAGQIYEGNPKDYTIDGDTVRWRFKDFKPRVKDHDIEITYLRPDVVAAVAQARDELGHDPTDPKSIIRLAKDLFALGPYNGEPPYPPSDLSLEELNQLLAKIEGPDRELFRSFYVLDEKGKYNVSDDSWQKRNADIFRILNAIDYHAPYSRSAEVDEARGLIEKLLQAHPDNAEAWNVYFANYPRFRFVGRGDVFYPHEIQQITKARAMCPNDPAIQLWFKTIVDGQTHFDLASGRRVGNGVEDQLKKEGILKNDLPKIDYDYY